MECQNEKKNTSRSSYQDGYETDWEQRRREKKGGGGKNKETGAGKEEVGEGE